MRAYRFAYGTTKMQTSKPVDLSFVVGDEVVVCFAEVFATKEARGGGEWRGVRGFQNQMFASVDVRALLLRVVSPEDEDEVFAFLGECVNDGIGEDFPAAILMRARSPRANRQRRVQ